MRTYVNLLLVMVLGGMWHGAAYTYIVWGALHGGRWRSSACSACTATAGGAAISPSARPGSSSCRASCSRAWVFFRSGRVGEAGPFVANIAGVDDWSLETMEWVGLLFLLPHRAALHLVVWLRNAAWCEPGLEVKAVLAAGMVYGIVTLYAGTADFIYFQF